MKKIYIAGAYSADTGLEMLDNIRKGMRMATKVMLAGFAPYCPWLDHQFAFMLREREELIVEDYRDVSMEWLKVSDAMLVLPKFLYSVGTAEEIKVAKSLGIPIYFTFADMVKGVI